MSLVRRLLRQPDAIVTRGSTAENRDNLPSGFLRSVQARFGRSLLGRQELLGELIDEIEGALWSRALIEECREEGAAGCPAKRVVKPVTSSFSGSGARLARAWLSCHRNVLMSSPASGSQTSRLRGRGRVVRSFMA